MGVCHSQVVEPSPAVTPSPVVVRLTRDGVSRFTALCENSLRRPEDALTFPTVTVSARARATRDYAAPQAATSDSTASWDASSVVGILVKATIPSNNGGTLTDVIAPPTWGSGRRAVSWETDTAPGNACRRTLPTFVNLDDRSLCDSEDSSEEITRMLSLIDRMTQKTEVDSQAAVAGLT